MIEITYQHTKKILEYMEQNNWINDKEYLILETDAIGYLTARRPSKDGPNEEVIIGEMV